MTNSSSHTALRTEEAVLGALLVEKGAIHQVVDILKTPQAFTAPKNQFIYEAATALFEKGEPVDLLTIADQLRSTNHLDKCGGLSYLSSLTNNVHSSANIQYHARILIQNLIKQKYVDYSISLHDRSQDGATDVTELLDFSQNFNNEISRFYHAGDSHTMTAASKEFFEILERQMQRTTELAGYSTSFAGVDQITLGLQDASMIVVAGRPAQGKTVFGTNIAVHVAKTYGLPVAIFSLEMPKHQLVARMLSAQEEVVHDGIKKGRLSEYDLDKLRNSSLHELPIHIYDNSNLTINELRAHAIRLYYEHGVRLIIVDYLQLMHGKRKNGGSREEEVSSISRGLKVLARELGIPIIVMSQLSRATVQRGGDKKPDLSDLRESGAIEQDADTVIFVHRPETYGFDVDQNGESLRGKAIIIIAKHRHGSTGEVPLDFKGPYYKFCNVL